MTIKRLSKMLFGLSALALATASLSRDAVLDDGYHILTSDRANSPQQLRALIDPLFDSAVGETRAVLVLHDGRIIAERYAPGFGPDQRMLSWSLAKTVTALLVGIMVGDGQLALDDPAPVAAWRQAGDPRGAITLRHLLHMASGLSHVENSGPLERTDALRMFVGPGAPDQAGYAQAKPLVDQPGSRFNYSSASTMILSAIVTDRLTNSRDPQVRHDAMAQFMAARLTGPLGLRSLVAEYDEAGTMLGGAMMHMSARDYARIGELLRSHGRVGERQIVPQAWIDFMTSSSPANPGYGGQLWLNHAGGHSDLFPGEAPPEIFGMSGYRGQYVIVSPAQGVTIVRLGISDGAEMRALRHALAQLVRSVK